MDESNRRQFIRVDVHRDAHLYFGARNYRHSINNLSLGGMFVTGSSKQKPGDLCRIRFSSSGIQENEDFDAAASVVRVSEDGMALHFTSMGLDSFLRLQTMLLYETGDSLVLGEEPVSYALL